MLIIVGSKIGWKKNSQLEAGQDVRESKGWFRRSSHLIYLRVGREAYHRLRLRRPPDDVRSEMILHPHFASVQLAYGGSSLL